MSSPASVLGEAKGARDNRGKALRRQADQLARAVEAASVSGEPVGSRQIRQALVDPALRGVGIGGQTIDEQLVLLGDG